MFSWAGLQSFLTLEQEWVLPMLLYGFILWHSSAFYPFIATWKTYLGPAGADVQKLWSVLCSEAPCAEDEGPPPPFFPLLPSPILLPLPSPLPPSPQPSFFFFFKNNH